MLLTSLLLLLLLVFKCNEFFFIFDYAINLTYTLLFTSLSL